MQALGQLITLRDVSGAKAVVAPELGGWLLRYMRHLPGLGYVDALYFAQEVVDRYPNQMYAGNPLLFPQVSFSHLPGREHHYEVDGKVYALPQHGFARRSKWKVTDVSESRVVMELSDSEDTRRAYPYRFRHEVTYELVDGRLRLGQVVENRGEATLRFSTGIHPYFPAPISAADQPRAHDGTRRNDCYVELPAARRVVPVGNWESWSTEEYRTRKLSVSEDVSGTLFLTDLAAPEVSLVNPGAGLRITLNFAQAPKHRYVAIWSKSLEDPFYCIEPWTALPNSLVRKKSELLELQPGEKFHAGMWMNIARA